MQPITDLERAAALHWRGTTEARLGEWLLRAAEGFTGRANSALPLGDPGKPLGEAIDTVTGWYRALGLPPMIAVPLPITDDETPARELDTHLEERFWRTRPGPAFVMVADLPLGIPLDGLPAGTRYQADRQPDDFAEEAGLSKVFLQVETDNTAALSLYERCGFRYSHRYHYRVAPARP
jgi:hypothetical protein